MSFRDRSLGDLDCLSSWDRNSMSALLRNQSDAERAQRTAEDTPECTPPKLAAEFNTTRMFLSHFGLLNKLVGVLVKTKKDCKKI